MKTLGTDSSKFIHGVNIWCVATYLNKYEILEDVLEELLKEAIAQLQLQ